MAALDFNGVNAALLQELGPPDPELLDPRVCKLEDGSVIIKAAVPDHRPQAIWLNQSLAAGFLDAKNIQGVGLMARVRILSRDITLVGYHLSAKAGDSAVEEWSNQAASLCTTFRRPLVIAGGDANATVDGSASSNEKGVLWAELLSTAEVAMVSQGLEYTFCNRTTGKKDTRDYILANKRMWSQMSKVQTKIGTQSILSDHQMIESQFTFTTNMPHKSGVPRTRPYRGTQQRRSQDWAQAWFTKNRDTADITNLQKMAAELPKDMHNPPEQKRGDSKQDERRWLALAEEFNDEPELKLMMLKQARHTRKLRQKNNRNERLRQAASGSGTLRKWRLQRSHPWEMPAPVNAEETALRHKSYWDAVFSPPTCDPFVDAGISWVHQISGNRMMTALSRVQDRRAADHAGITAELLKLQPESTVEALLKIADAIALKPLEADTFVTRVTMLPKKTSSDPDTPSAWRPISIIPLPLKVIGYALLTTINEHRLPIPDYCFGITSSVTQMVSSIKAVSELQWQYGRPLVMVKVDISKAFDATSWRQLQDAMTYFQIPGWAQMLLLRSFAASTMHMSCGNLQWSTTARRSIPQGHPCSPILFAMCMCYTVKDLRLSWIRRNLGVPTFDRDGKLHNLYMYFDDIVLLATSTEAATIMLNELSQAFANAGWLINAQKTEWAAARIPARAPSVQLNDAPCTRLPTSAMIRWLGVWFNVNGRSTGAWKITRQRALASFSFWKPILTCNADLALRKRLLTSTVGSVATWGAEFLTPHYTSFERLAALHRHMLSKMIRLPRKEKEFLSGWYRRRLRLAGKMQRAGPSLPWNIVALNKFWKLMRQACFWERNTCYYQSFWDFSPADQLTLQMIGTSQLGRGRGPGHRKGRPSGWLEAIANWGLEKLGQPWHVYCRAVSEQEWTSQRSSFWCWVNRKRPEAEQQRLIRHLFPGGMEDPRG